MGGDDGEANHFCLLHCLTEGSRDRRKAKPKEEKTRRAVDRPPLTAPAVTPNTPITIVTMAMAVSRPPNDWVKFKNPACMQAFARCCFREA
jgi:hypothetical protein